MMIRMRNEDSVECGKLTAIEARRLDDREDPLHLPHI